jgi:hypothetical protein
LTCHLTVDQLCKIIVEVGRYCAYLVNSPHSAERLTEKRN